MRCYRRLLNISYKDHVTNKEVRNRIQNAIGMHGDLLTMVKKLKLRWYGVISRSAGMAKTILQWKVQEGEEDRRRDGKITSTNGQEQCLEIPWEQRKTLKGGKVLLQRHLWYPTTSEVKWLRWDETKVKQRMRKAKSSALSQQMATMLS